MGNVAVNDEDEYDEDDFPPLDQEDDQSGKKSDNASPDHLKFRSFLVTNRVPSTRKINHNEKPANQNSTSNLFTIKDRIKQTLLICQEAWFTLKKFVDFTNKPQVDTNSLPRNVRKAMEKFNEDGFIQLDVEKALMLANA